MKLLRSILLALLLSRLVGLAVGTLLRMRLERPVRYLGSVPVTFPLHVGNSRAPVLDPRHDEQQIREPIQVAETRLGHGLEAV